MMRARMMQSSVRSAELKTNLAKLWRCAESARWQFGSQKRFVHTLRVSFFVTCKSSHCANRAVFNISGSLLIVIMFFGD
jgi:hypothetical protein